MQAIPATGLPGPLPLYGTAATRAIESTALAQHAAHQLMERAGAAVARWGRALYPHARRVWVACGPGNNGGDGLVAARHWQAALGTYGQVTATWLGDPTDLPPDAQVALQTARAAGVQVTDTPPHQPDLVVDALWGVGLQRDRPWPDHLHSWLRHINQGTLPVLAVDVPSGLDSDTGAWLGPADALPAAGRGPRHTLTLLTAKPGLFMGHGRDAAGDIWWEDLGVSDGAASPDAYLNHLAPDTAPWRGQRHNAHKGSHGDVVVLGGQDVSTHGVGMGGAALLAARAALRAGAGRVYVAPMPPEHKGPAIHWDLLHPELMFRHPEVVFQGGAPSTSTLVCGCGGGTAIAPWLASALNHAGPLVLDADALNHIAEQPVLQTTLAQRRDHERWTVLTPHPLEAARLLGSSTERVQADRLRAAKSLAKRLNAVVVLKGSGTVIAAPDATPWVNPTGNALLATAGTGDVLAGLLGAALATALPNGPAAGIADVLSVTRQAVFHHGLSANHWRHPYPMTASDIC